MAQASGPSSNRVLNYQIRLTDSSGIPVANGTKNLKLTFYTLASGGTQLYTACSADGSPTGTPTAVVATFTSGTATVLIGDALTCASGSAVAIPATLFDNTAIFLGVTVEADAEMTPRKRIVAAGYALNADKLDDLETSNAGGSNAFVPVTDSSGNFTLTRNVTVDTDTFFVDAANNRVGIGTTTPGVQLHVTGGGTGNDIARFERTVGGSGSISINSANSYPQMRFDTLGPDFTIGVDPDSSDFRVVSGSGISAGVPTPLLTVESNGSVAVGVANPIGKFQVQSADAAGTGTLSSSGTTVTGTGTAFTTQLAVGDTIIASAQTRRVTAIATDTSLTTDTAFAPALSAASFTFSRPRLLVQDAGNVGIGDADPANFRLEVAGNVGPSVDDTHDLGSNTLRWRDLYLGPATLHIGTATGDEGALTYNTTTNLLSIDSTGAVDINGGSGSTGCSVDASGNFACSGTVTGGGGSAFVNGGNSFGGVANLGTNDNFGINIETNGTTRLNINQSGDMSVDTNTLFVDAANNRIGIGTTSPAHFLHISSASTGPRALIESTSNNSVAELNFKTRDGSAVLKEVNIFGDSFGNFGIYTQSGGSGGSNKLIMTSAGNLGVGDTSPASLLTVGSGDRFNVNAFGDVTSTFTQLDGTDLANGAGASATTLVLDDTTGFNAGNYLLVNTTYAKIVSVDSGTNLTISPALTWADNAQVDEYHIPEVGGVDLTQALANRYGRGYFIDGIVAGNGTTYITDGSIESTGAFKINTVGNQPVNFGTGTVTIPGTLAVTNSGTSTFSGPLQLANIASDPTGSNGLMYYNSASNKFRCFENGVWTDCVGSGSTGFSNGGNSFGGAATLGTNDNFAINFETNNITKLTLGTATDDIVTIVGGTLTNTKNALALTATLPAVAAGNSGIEFTTTSAGSVNDVGFQSILLAGATGTATTAAIQGSSNVATNAAAGRIWGTSGVNAGVLGANLAANTSADKAGVFGNVSGDGTNYGVFGRAADSGAGKINIGVAGQAQNPTGTQVGGLFRLTTGGTAPTISSAALIASNGGETAPIFLANDNDTTVFTIADGGDLTATGDLALNGGDLTSNAAAFNIANNTTATNINIGNALTTGAITIGGTGAQTGLIGIGTGTGAQTINLGTGGTGVKTINIGTGGVANPIVIGNSTGATSIALNTGTGSSLNLGTNAIAHTVTLGNITGATAVNINVGTGNFALNGVAGSTYTVGAATTTGAITIGGTAQTGNLTLGSSTGTNSVLIGNGTGATIVSIANANTGGTVNIGNALTTGTINIATGANTGTFSMGTGAGAQTANLFTGGAVKTVSLGSTNTTSSLALNAGSGGINLTGNLTTLDDIALNGGDLTTTAATGNLFNANATTVNVGGAATTLNLAGGSGSTGCTVDGSGNLACSGTISGSGSGAFVNGGNSFGAAATLGTNDNFSLALETNGTTRVTVESDGTVGIGDVPSSMLTVTDTQVGNADNLVAYDDSVGNGINLWSRGFNITNGSGFEIQASGAVTGGQALVSDLLVTHAATATLSGVSNVFTRNASGSGGATTLTVSGALAEFSDTVSCVGCAGLNHTADTVRIMQANTTASGSTLNVASAGTGPAMRVNDDGTYADSTPFVIDADGKVGVGTTAPATGLTVQGSSLAGWVRATDGTVSTDLQHTSSAGFAGTSSAHPFSIITGNSARMTFDTSGNAALGSSTLTNGLFTLRRTGAGTVFAVRNTADSASTFTVTDTGATTASGLITASAGLTVAAGQTLTLTTTAGLVKTAGTGVFTWAHSPAANQTSNAIGLTLVTGADTTGTQVHNGFAVIPTIGNATVAGNTTNFFSTAAFTGDAEQNVNALNIGGMTGTTATERAINIGSGWDAALVVNGATVIDGAGNLVAGTGSFTGNVVPSADNTYDLGTTSSRWKTLHVGPGSVVVHNDATDTDKVTLGYSGATALLATSAGTPLQLTTDANNGIVLAANGNLTYAGGVAAINDNSNFNVSIAGGTSTGQVDVGAGATTQALNIGTGAGAKTVTIGSTTGAGALVLRSGTGGGSYTTTETTGSGMGIVADSLSTGVGLGVASAATALAGTAGAGSLLNISKTGASGTADFVSGASIARIGYTQTFATAAATRNVAGNTLTVSRAITTNNGTTVANVSGSLVNFSSGSVQTLGTLNDSADILNLAQTYASATGDVLTISNAGTGKDINGTSWSVNKLGNFTTSGSSFDSTSSNFALAASATSMDILGGSGSTGCTISSTGKMSCSGGLDAGSNIITNVATPSANTDAVNKSYVDSLASGLSWQSPVIDYTATAPGSPTNGDRYIVLSGSAFSPCTTNQVCTRTGGAWVGATPSQGWTAYVTAKGEAYNFNGTTWVSVGSATNHNSLSGLQGGTSSEYFHLTSAQHSNLTSVNPSFAQFTVAGTTNTGTVLTITDASLTTGTALSVTSTSTSTTNAPNNANLFDVTFAQASNANTTAFNGVAVDFTQNPSVTGNTENMLRLQNEVTSTSGDDVNAALLINNADTTTTGTTAITNAIQIANSGSGLTATTAYTNYFNAPNFLVTSGGAVTATGGLTIGNGSSGAYTQTFTGGGTAASITANSLTSGTGLSIASTATAMTTGGLFNAARTGTGGATAYTGDIGRVAWTHTYNAAATINNTGNILDVSRNMTTSIGTANITTSGDLVTFSDTSTQTLGSLANSARVLVLTQNYAAATGDVLAIANSGTGKDISGTGGVWSIDKTGLFTTADGIAINSGNITTTSTTANLFSTNATTVNVGDAATTLTLAGGSGSTGCTVDGSGNFACAGTITGSGGGAAYLNGGNSFGTFATLGTNDSFDLNLETNSVTRLTIGADAQITYVPDTATDLFNVTVGNLKVGNGAQTNALDGEDAYIEGGFEVDGAVRFDGAINANGALTTASTTAFNANSNITKASGTGTFVFSTSTATSGFSITNTGTTVSPNNAILLAPSGATTGTGVGIVADGLTTGNGLSVSNANNTNFNGTLLQLTKTGTTGSTAFTDDIAGLAYSQTFTTAGTVNSTGNVFDISRSITMNQASQTHTVSGALASFVDSGTQTAGTLTHTANVLALSQAYASATGSVLAISNGGTGADVSGTSNAWNVSKTGLITTADDVAVNGGDVTTTAATANLFNVTATTVNIGGAATSLTLSGGAGSTGCTIDSTGALTCDGLFVGPQAALLNGGNSIGSTLMIGTSDNNAVSFQTNNVTRMTLNTSNVLTFTNNASTIDLASGTAGNTFDLKIPTLASGTCSSGTAEGLIIKDSGGTQRGHICIDSGTPLLKFYANQFNTTSTDIAENYSTRVEDGIEAGDVVELDPAGDLLVRKTTEKGAAGTFGVVSTAPGIVLSGIDEATGESDTVNSRTIALKGRVPVKVNMENGPIAVGDYLASSSVPGVAMKSEGTGMVIGRALDAASADGTVRVFLEVGYWSGGADVASTTLASSPQPLSSMQGPLDMGGYGITTIGSLSGINSIWTIDGEGNFLTKGVVAAKVATDNGDVTVYATGSQKAEITLSGTGQLVNGVAEITFDDVSQHIISGGTPIKVTVTLTADAQGVYVTDKTIHGFAVHELNGGTSNATFDWMAIARRKGFDDVVEPVEEPVEPPTEAPVPPPEPAPAPEETTQEPVVSEEPTPEVIPEPSEAQETPTETGSPENATEEPEPVDNTSETQE